MVIGYYVITVYQMEIAMKTITKDVLAVAAFVIGWCALVAFCL